MLALPQRDVKAWLWEQGEFSILVLNRIENRLPQPEGDLRIDSFYPIGGSLNGYAPTAWRSGNHLDASFLRITALPFPFGIRLRLARTAASEQLA